MFKKALTLSLFLLLPVWPVQAGWVVNPDITQINFTTSPQTIDVDTISNVMTVQTQDATGISATVGTTTIISLSSDSATGEFSSNNVIWIPAISLVMRRDSANRSFYYRDSIVGTSTITVSASIYAWTPATQFVFINATSGPATSTPDTTAPVITLLGEAIVNLLVGDTYADAGVTVMDDIDGDITASTTAITTIGLPIDTSATGTQYIIYTATDSSSNSASTTRTINISEPAPVVIPVSETAPSRSSGSSGYVQNISFLLANPNASSTEGQVLGASTSRMSEETRQRRLAHFRRRLLEIKRELLLLEHPELKEIILAEDPLAIISTTTLEVVEATTTTSSSTDPVKKPFWKFW